MDVIKLILAIFTATFIGWNILYLVSFKSHKLYFFERIFISYGLGFGALTLEMFMLFLFNIKFGPVEMIGPWMLLFIFNLSVNFRNRGNIGYRTQYPDSYGKNALGIFLLIGIIFETLYAFFRALIKPIEAYDAIATFAIKSKIFYLAKSIPGDYFYNLGCLFPHVDYPLNVPLSETFVYLFLGNLNEQLVKIVFPLYFIAILGILYFGIRRFASRTYALIFTFALASIPQFNNFATNAYIDVPLSYYYLAATLFLFYWFKERDAVEFLYISAIMTALAGWTKNEGLVYCVINIIVLAVFLLSNKKNLKSRDIAHGFGYVALIVMILLPWLMIRKTAHLVNYDFGVLNVGRFDIIKQLHKIIPMLYEFQRQIFGPKKWNIFWVVFILTLVIYRKKAFAKYQAFMTIPLLLILGSYITAYLLAQTEMPTLWSRFMIHFLPIAVYLLAILLKDEVKV